MKQVIPIPDEEGFVSYMTTINFSKSYRDDILYYLKYIIRETGAIPTDLNRFNEDYLDRNRFSKNKKTGLRVAVRKYREYRKAKFGEEFIDT